MCKPYMLQWPPLDVAPKGAGIDGSRSDVLGQSWGQGGGLYSVVQCAMGNGHVGILPVNKQTDRY